MTWQLGLNATTLSANMKHLSSLASTMHRPYRPRRITAARASGHMLRKRWRSKGSCTSSSAEELGIPRSVKVSTYFYIFLHISTYFYIFLHISTYYYILLHITTYFYMILLHRIQERDHVRYWSSICFSFDHPQVWLFSSAFWASGVTQWESQSQSRTPFHLGNCGEWDFAKLDSIGPPMNQSASICINRLISTLYWYWEWDVSGNRMMLIARNLHHCHEWSITAKVP